MPPTSSTGRGKSIWSRPILTAFTTWESLAGISTHNPKILETLQEKGFANDFYMAGLHYLSRHPEDWMRDIGTLPLGEGLIASDPPKMAEAMRKVDKPALVYKVLAAGRKCESEEQKRQAIEWAYQEHQADGCDDYRLLPALFRPGHRNHSNGARESCPKGSSR